MYWSTPVRGQELAKFSSTIKYLWSAWEITGGTYTTSYADWPGYIRQDVTGDFTELYGHP
jgi:hypothetical protein